MLTQIPPRPIALVFLFVLITFLGLSCPLWAQQKAEKHFNAVVTDAKGVEMELKNVMYYWEEKVNETSFVPHELRYVPVKRGAATVNVKFETIKQIEMKPSQDSSPVLHITLLNGKTGEFQLAIPGTFKGESDFGDVEIQPVNLRKLTFK